MNDVSAFQMFACMHCYGLMKCLWTVFNLCEDDVIDSFADGDLWCMCGEYFFDER